MKFFGIFWVLTALFLAGATPALAHRVHIFATVQGGEIVADCRFSKKNPARNAKIEVLDAASGKLLLSGKSDAQGAARLALPPELAADPVDLLLVLDAGEGHRGEWRIGADELRNATATPVNPAKPEDDSAASPTTSPSAASIPAAANSVCISPEDLAARLRDQETRLRAEAAAQGPGPTEIIGGLGWIAGIFSGIAALKRRMRALRA